jgi:thiol:disulfide interchange protein DsbD
MSVRLVSDQTSIPSGSSFTLGVVFKPDPGWHIYWKNPGDSGLPPRFTWKASPGVTIKDPLWPYPDRIPAGPLITYGFERGEAMIPFPATIDSRRHGSSVTVKLVTQWLVCKEECLPGKAELSVSLPVTATQGVPSQEAALFENTFSAIPAPLDRVSVAIEEQDDSLNVALIPLDGRFLPGRAAFFPEDPRIISNAAPQESTKDGEVLTIRLKRDRNRKESISRLRGVLVSEQGWSPSGTPRAVYLDTNPEVAEPSTAKTKQAASTHAENTAAEIGFLTALAFAFIGGFILNLMPCVYC